MKLGGLSFGRVPHTVKKNMIKKWKLRRSSVDLSGSNSDFSKLYDGIDTCFDLAKVHFFWRISDDFRKVYEIRHIIYSVTGGK